MLTLGCDAGAARCEGGLAGLRRGHLVADAQRMLGLCFMALGQREHAEELLLASYRTLAPAKNWYHRTLGEQTRRDLATLYTSWGRRAEAARIAAGGAP